MANVTGDTVQEVSDQLTSVWNNFYDGSHSLEYYIDVMTELGAATASSSSEIADGLQDFAAIAGMIGLDFDRAATMIATTASVSRQSADIIGTSFRSIFSRIQGLQMGETLEDGVDLNKYSTALQKVGINVLDASGNLRDMNGILDEMGAKWQELSQTEQTALAQTVAGVWQYNNLVTLMDNWDTFEQNLAIAQNSAGTLEEQSQIYEESWVAASNRVKAALEDVYNSILDSDAFKNLLDGIADVITGFDTFIDSIGGLPGALALIGAVSTKVFHDQLASGVRFASDTMFQLTGLTSEYHETLKQNTLDTLLNSQDSGYPLMGNKAQEDILRNQVQLQNTYNEKVRELSELEREALDLSMQATDEYAKRYQAAADAQDQAQVTFESARAQFLAQIDDESLKDTIYGLTDVSAEDATKRVDEVVNKLTELSNKDLYNTNNIENFREELKKLSDDVFTDNFGGNRLSISQRLSDELASLASRTDLTIDDIQSKLRSLSESSAVSTQAFFDTTRNQVEALAQTYNAPDQIKYIKNTYQFADSITDLGKHAQETNQQMASFHTRVESMMDTLKQGSQDVFFRASNGIVSLGNALANATLSIMTMQSAWDTLTSSDTSFFDKALSTILTLSVTIPSLVELMNAIKLIREADILAAIAQLATSAAHVASLKAETTATAANTKEIKENTVEKTKNAAATTSQTVTETAGNVLDNVDTDVKKPKNQRWAETAIELASLGGLGNSIKSLFASLGSTIISVGKLLIRFLPQIGAVIAALTALKFAMEAINAFVLRDDTAYDLEQTTEAVQNLTLSYNEAKAAQDELQSNIDSYNSAIDTIDSLTRGTQEYTQAILDANDAAIQLIQSTDEIGAGDWSVGEDGLIEISESAIQKATQAQLDELIQSQSAMQMTTRQQSELQTENSINELIDNVGQSARAVLNAAIEDPTITDEASSIAELLGLSEDSPIVQEIYEARGDINDLVKAVDEDRVSREQTAQSVAEQILSANDIDSTSRSGQIYNQAYQDAYESAMDTIPNFAWQENSWQEIMEQAGFTQEEIDSANYNRFDQALTYERKNDDGELETVTISDEELANLAAAAKAQDDLVESAKRLTRQINELKNSTDETDHSIASFIEDGNLENLTYDEYEAVRNMSKADQKAALGLTGNYENDLQVARDAGYDSASEYWKAFKESLEVEWEIPEGISEKLADSLTIGASQKINENIKNMSSEAAQTYVDSINNFSNELVTNFNAPTEDVQNFVNSLANIEVNSGGIQAFVQEMADLGYTIDTSTEDWNNFVQTLYESQNYIPNLDKLSEDLKAIHEIVDDIELGDIISEEDYNTLVGFNGQLEKYFTILMDGSARLTGDPLDLSQLINGTEIQRMETDLERLKNLQETYQNAANADYFSQDWQSAARSQGLNSRDEQEAFRNKYVQDQLDILRQSDFNNEQIAKWSEQIEKGGEKAKEAYNGIAEAVGSVSNQFIDASAKADEFGAEAQKIMNELAMNMDANEASDAYRSGEINAIAYGQSAEARINEDKYENVDIEEVQDYADYVQNAAKSSEEFSDELIDNAEAAEDVALATMRMNEGAETLIDNWDNWGDILKNSSKESEEYADAVSGVRGALSDLLQVSEDFISNDFVAEHLNEIEAAAMGDTNAIDTLRSAMAKDIIMDVTLNNQGIREEALGLFNDVSNLLSAQDIQIGATIDDAGIIGKINEILRITGMSVEEAQAMLNSLGFEPTFQAKKQWLHEWTPVYETTMKITGIESNSGSPLPDTFKYEQSTKQVGKTYHSWQTEVPAWSADGTPQVTSLTATGGGSMSGGFSGFNYAPSNSGGSPAYTPSDSGGGGGGGGSDKAEEPTPAEPMDYTDEEEVLERYYEITDSLDDMTDALDDAADAADRLYGKNRIAAMEQQRDLMEQQRDLLQQYRSEIEAYLAKDKAALENNEYGIHFTFDADGDITNYTQIMTDLYNQLHAAEQTYNSFATKEEQDAYQESTLDPLNKKIEEIKNLIDTYDNTQDLLVDVDNQIRDALNEWQDQNYEILTYKIELQIEINDLEQERLDYYLNKYEDDFYKMAESMALTGDSFPLLTNNLETYKKEMEQLNQAYHNGEISQDAFIEGMKEVNSGLLENMNALVDLDREMLQYYENTLDSAEDKLSDFTDQLEHQMSILEHYQNVLGLIGKEQDYQMVGAVLQGQFSVAQDQLAAQERWVETLRNQMADIQSDLLSAVDEKEREALNEQLLLVTQRLNEAEESVNSLRESVLELAQSILENDLANYAQQLSENLVEGLGFGNLDEYLDTIDKLNTSQEEYLTTTNKVYETNKLIRQAQEDMAENDSLLAKQRYQEYIDYVEQLQEQGRLSEYELRIAQARYEVLQAQIALEEAQNAKDTMRLVRDSQGNYNYVYTANQDNISQAQQALEDAENNLYNIGLEGAQNYQDKYAQILEEAFNAFKDLSEQYKNGEITSEEEFNQKRLELQNYYYNRLKDIQDLYYIAHDLLVDESFTNEADYLFAGIGNLEDFKDATDQYLQDCNNAFDEWQENTEVATDSVGNGMGDLQDHIQDVTDTSSNLTDQIQDDLIPALEDELEAVRDMTNLWLSHRDALYETLQAYEELQQGAQNTISSAAGVQPGGVLPDIPEEYQADIGAIMAAYLQQGGSINDDLFQQLWNKRNEKIEWLAANGYSSSYWGSYGEETIKGFEELVSGGGDQDWYDYAANMYTIEQIRQFLQQMGLPTFKTGGYTGSWGPNGRLAIIHEKELILNQDDTNSLINIIREYGKLKSNNINSMDIFNSSFNDIITKFKSIINKINFNNQDRIAAQQVSIEASFPNVSVASEIEDAFNDLLNRAAQYVSLNRTNY